MSEETGYTQDVPSPLRRMYLIEQRLKKIEDEGGLTADNIKALFADPENFDWQFGLAGPIIKNGAITTDLDVGGTIYPLSALFTISFGAVPEGKQAVVCKTSFAGSEIGVVTDHIIEQWNSNTAAEGLPVTDGIPAYGNGGRIRIGDGYLNTDAVNLSQLNSRLSPAQRTAIDALDAATATVEDLINALRAV